MTQQLGTEDDPGWRARVVEFRLVPAAVAGWAVAAWVVGERPAHLVLGGGLALAVMAVGVLWLGTTRRVAPTVSLVLAAAGFTMLITAVRGGGEQDVKILAQQRLSVAVLGRVEADPAPVRSTKGPARYQYRVVVESVRRPWDASARVARGSVQVFARDGEVLLGSQVEVTGRLAPAEPGRREAGVLTVNTPAQVIAPPGVVFRSAERLRGSLRQACEDLSPDARGLVPAMVTGDTSAVPADLTDVMRNSGLAHLTAVSGTNVTIICGAVLLGLGLVGAGPRARVVGGVVALIGFVLIARPQPSVVRAATMGAVGLVGLLQGRRGSGISALSSAVLVLCVLDPWLARDIGFVLSVGATGAIVLLGRPMAGLLERVMPRWLALSLAIPVVAQLICGPILILLRPTVALYSVPANLVVAPLVGPTTVLGCLALLLSAVWPAGGAGLAWMAGLGASGIAWVGRATAALPGATLTWHEGWLGVVLLLAAGVGVIALVVLLVWLEGRWQVTRWVMARRFRQVAAVALTVAVVLVGVVVMRIRSGPWPIPGWRVVACDVGQGDGLVISTGPGHAVVVDAGPDSAPIRGCLDRLDIEVVDLLVLTHFHADHVDGVGGVTAGRTIGRVLVSPLNEPRDGVVRVRTEVQRAGVEMEVAQAGMRGTVGDLSFEVIHPVAGETFSSGDGDSSAANNSSVAVVFRLPGFSLAALGDMEPLTQSTLTRVPQVDVVKVAHHGSRYQDEGLYQRLAPRLALISAGRNNDFGHPAPATLGFLERQGILVARTDLSGDLAVGVDNDGALWERGRRD